MKVLDSLFTRFLSTVLVIGFFAQVSGILYIVDGSNYATISNLGLFLPALILLAVSALLRKFIFDKTYLPVILLLGFTVFIAIVNKGSTNSVFHQAKIALYVSLYLGTIAILVRHGMIEKCLNVAFFVAALFAVATMVYQWNHQEQNIFISRVRIFSMGESGYGDFRNPIVAALYYGFFGIYGCNQLFTKRYSPILTGLLTLCVIALSMYLYCTLSRGVWLGYGLAIAAIIGLHQNRRSRKWLVGALVILSVVAVWLKDILIGQQARGFSLRDQIWGEWFSRLNEFWLMGAGAGNQFNVCIPDSGCLKQAHNLYLQFFYEYGVGGILLIIAVIIFAFLRAIDRRTWTAPLGTVGLPLLIFAIISATFNYHTVLSRPGVYWIVFWLPIGLLLAIKPTTGTKNQISMRNTGLV